MDKKQFVKWIYPQAKKNADISPVFVTAQAALESGWGANAIGNNLFGITVGSHWNGKKRLVLTHENFSRSDVKFNPPEKVTDIKHLSQKNYRYTVYRYFRDYDNVSDCLADHTSILKKPQFADAWPYRHDAVEFTRRIVDNIGSKYATDTRYVSTLLSVISDVSSIVKQLNL
jgi:flagellum-specific peptidoglycan hydrolase FlgJ